MLCSLNLHSVIRQLLLDKLAAGWGETLDFMHENGEPLKDFERGGDIKRLTR